MDEKRVPADRLIAEIASRQNGVVSVWQLRRLGIGKDAIDNRVRAGRLHRLHRGVLAVGHAAVTPEGRCVAAVLACGSQSRQAVGSVLDYWGAAVSHRSAASLWGLLAWSGGDIDVVVKRKGARRKRAGIQVHRPRGLPAAAVTLRRGIPVTTPARTISDLEMALASGRPGALPAHQLRRAIRQAGVLDLPLDEADPLDRTRSDLESDLLLICRLHRLPEPEVNVRVGPFLVDFLWRDARLVVETDSYRYHRGRAAFRQDHRRDLRLRRLGHDVVRFSEQQILEEAEEVAEELAASLSRGSKA